MEREELNKLEQKVANYGHLEEKYIGSQKKISELMIAVQDIDIHKEDKGKLAKIICGEFGKKINE